MLLIVAAIVLYFLYRVYRYILPIPWVSNVASRAVLISGCDTGFGHSLAISLDNQGYRVFAACLTQQGKENLAKVTTNKCVPFLCDITNLESVADAVKLVKSHTNWLHALVNNAGIFDGFFIDLSSLAVYRRTMEVNFFGHVNMTKSFLPLLLANPRRDSRVVTVTSVAGSVAVPSISAYSASKFALEAFTDALRREMRPW
jgi:NAD(P)-dependent dehydrogenase (short-subunit alcohol dehydrogenase family)